ncbi:TPA: hypothetical protein PCY80_000313 [Klebsiella aerogenes]|nr:hypothetical protein [Klebsiella aerogenes]
MRLEQRYQEMRGGYEKLAARLTPAQTDSQNGKTPAELEWAQQEGFAPKYNPNNNEITWVKTPEPAYSQPNVMRLEGSMSPERMAEMYPAFATKAKQIDPVLSQIYQAALTGEITHQRAQELVIQLAENTYKDAWKGKIKGASKTSSSFEQTLDNMSNTNKIAGE